ncbi:hypothetical protein ACJMK2_012788 [Sinanodonta woodiana]|uniref:RING-type E3 ubiquitin transferase n=1 Tax=Sinanodonta woodiana TaxID=1069815 RepID=A0ABD3VB89_SINWO
MPIQTPQWTEFLSCPVCYNVFSETVFKPISLACGHTICKSCLMKLQQKKCPFDQSKFLREFEELPVNYALLQLVGAIIPEFSQTNIENKHYEPCKKSVEKLALLLKPLSPGDGEDKTLSLNSSNCVLSRPMQRKLIALVNCQLVEEEGRIRAMKAARSLGERSVTELILQHQNPQQLSSNLWAAVRARGCQFLGPAMQEEVLRLILLALEDGSALSRKVLVLFVVQRLENQYPQSSKTAIGHVVQLLYRASCFKVTKRDGESSLMQLKEEFRTYEALRREHDTQIVQIAMEAGLRIAPDQWSSLLYGDSTHKSHMQSIIDKLQTPQTFGQSVNELVIALQRTGDPHGLQKLRPHLEFLSNIDPGPDIPGPSWENLEVILKAVETVVLGLVDFLKTVSKRHENQTPYHPRYKTSMCRDFLEKAKCPRGASCTFAHSEEELEKYRQKNRKTSRPGLSQIQDQIVATDGTLVDNNDNPATDALDSLVSSSKVQNVIGQIGSMSIASRFSSERPAHPNVATVAPSAQVLACNSVQTSSHQSMRAAQPETSQSTEIRPTMMPFDIGSLHGGNYSRANPPIGDRCHVPMGMSCGQFAYPGGLPQFMQPFSHGYRFQQLNPYAEPWFPCVHHQMAAAAAVSQDQPCAGCAAHYAGHHHGASMVSPAQRHTSHIIPQQIVSHQAVTSQQILPHQQVMFHPPMSPQGQGHLSVSSGQGHMSVSSGLSALHTCTSQDQQQPMISRPPPSHHEGSSQFSSTERQSLSHLHERRNELLAQLQQNSSNRGKTTGVESVCPTVEMSLTGSTCVRTDPSLSDIYPRGTCREDDSMPHVLQSFTDSVDTKYLFERLAAQSAAQPRSVTDAMIASRLTSALPQSVKQMSQMTVPCTVSVTSSMYESPASKPTKESDLDGKAGSSAKAEFLKKEDGDKLTWITNMCGDTATDMVVRSMQMSRPQSTVVSYPRGSSSQDEENSSSSSSKSHTAEEKEDEEVFIPFYPPIVSKYGPISRTSRAKFKTTGPLQVMADDHMKITTPVTAVTPLTHPIPNAITVPSRYTAENGPFLASGNMLSDSSPLDPLMEPYSLWKTESFHNLIQQEVARLEERAKMAVSEDERLSCELQAVEMQISLKQLQTRQELEAREAQKNASLYFQRHLEKEDKKRKK